MACECLMKVIENPTTGCVCAEAGWCERHKCQKTEHFHKLCRTRVGYFDLWENGKGPCIHSERSPMPIPKRGLGDWVAVLIHRMSFGFIEQTEGCGCGERQKALNRFGQWISLWWTR